MQVAYGNEPASAELCTAIDRESNGAVCYRDVNGAWEAKRGLADTRRRIPMDWDYLEQKMCAGVAEQKEGV
jgi:DNA-binding transcriptional regulator YdaS (Cro superfamily)